MPVTDSCNHCGADGGLHRRRAVDGLETQRSSAPQTKLPPPSERRRRRADGDLGMVADRNIDRVLGGAAHDVRHLRVIIANHIDECTLHRARDNRRAVRAAETISGGCRDSKALPPNRACVDRLRGVWCLGFTHLQYKFCRLIWVRIRLRDITIADANACNACFRLLELGLSSLQPVHENVALHAVLCSEDIALCATGCALRRTLSFCVYAQLLA